MARRCNGWMRGIPALAVTVALTGCVGGGSRVVEGNEQDARADYVECLTAYTLIQRAQGRTPDPDAVRDPAWCGGESERYHAFVVDRAYRVTGPGRMQTADAVLASVWDDVTGGVPR